MTNDPITLFYARLRRKQRIERIQNAALRTVYGIMLIGLGWMIHAAQEAYRFGASLGGF